MSEYFPITDAIASAFPRPIEELRLNEAKKAILNTTTVPIPLVDHNLMLQGQGFRDDDIRIGVSELISSKLLKLNQDRTIVNSKEYQLPLGLEQEITSSEP